MKYHISNLKGTNTVVHVPTLELAKEVDKILIAAGGMSMSSNWDVYKEKTCFYLKDLPWNSYSDIDYFKNHRGSTIITGQEFINDNRKMKYKVGDKVVPINKSYGCSLENSLEWGYAKEHNVGYLTVYRIENDGIYNCCTGEIKGGDYFRESDLIPYEEPFTLPKKWAIKVVKGGEETNPEVYKWRGSHFGNEGYIHSDKWHSSQLLEGYTEITLEQFKKHVLKQSDMKKIIGYKVKPEFTKFAIAMVKSSFSENQWNLDKINFTPNFYQYDTFKEAGVLDLWFEPVYEEEKPEFKVGDWVWCTLGSIRYIGKLTDIDKISMEMWRAKESNTSSSGGRFNKIEKAATREEIKEHLIKMAQSKGFVRGLPLNKVKSWTGGFQEYAGYGGNLGKNDWRYNFDTDELTNLYVPIYCQGKWATILPQENIISVSCESGQFNVHITEEGFKFGGHTAIKVQEIERLLDSKNVGMWVATANTFTIGCKINIPRKDLEALIEAYEAL